MKYSTRTRYGLRFLIQLTKNQSKKSYSLTEIADSENISVKYLEQIIRLLKPLDIIQSERGKTGGYALKVAPEKIMLYDVFSVLEGDVSGHDCSQKGIICHKLPDCCATSVWKNINDLIEKYLKNTSLKDAVQENKISCPTLKKKGKPNDLS